MEKERLQKFLSSAGVASRRAAEELIQQGKVLINGRKAKLGDKVDPEKDEIVVSGKTIKQETKLYYIAVNKPKGYISSRRDPQKRRSVFSLLPKELQNKVWNVGRLDFFTEGLMLFTNDGDVTQRLAHPKFEHDKEYEVLLNEPLTDSGIGKLRRGVAIGDGYVTQPATIRVRGERVYITIHEGKKHQIRRMFEAIGLKVKNLKRIRMNKLELDGLPLGKYKFVDKKEII